MFQNIVVCLISTLCCNSYGWCSGKSSGLATVMLLIWPLLEARMLVIHSFSSKI